MESEIKIRMQERAKALERGGDLRHDLRNKVGMIGTYLKVIMGRPKIKSMNEAVRLFQQQTAPSTPQERTRLKTAYPKFHRLSRCLQDIMQHVKSIRFADKVTLHALKEIMPLKIDMAKEQLKKVTPEIRRMLEEAKVDHDDWKYYLSLVDSELDGQDLDQMMDIIHATDPYEQARPFDLSELVAKFRKPPGTGVQTPQGPVMVHGTPEALFGHFDQLLTNAEQHQRAGVQPRRKITVKKVGGEAHIEFIDNGQGIPKEDLERVFDKDFTTREEGTGLGLSKFRKLVEEHGGRTWAESQPGHWTKICVRLPLHKPAE